MQGKHRKHRKGDSEEVADTLTAEAALKHLIGRSPSFLQQVQRIREIAGYDVPVLIRGESGTGKELFAEAIHYLSPRAGQPFLAVNCGQIPCELVANEFFGHVAGAYTGAASDSGGLIGRARGGTLLLDEIDSLPFPAQSSLLRFLQDHQQQRLGSDRCEYVDVRILTSTNADLLAKVNAGHFRLDLYFRINDVELVLPSLRERREDIPLLADFFIYKYAEKFKQPARRLSPACLAALDLYTWPGNIRELEGAIRSALLRCHSEVIEPEHLNSRLMAAPEGAKDEAKWETFAQAKARANRDYLAKTLAAARGNVRKAASLAVMSSGAMSKLLRKYEVQARSVPGPE